jgi:alpha-1,6-mannosyltransferase
VLETFGLVTLEAQACGTPVVGIRGSYMDRIIYGGQEHWAEENTAPALAEAVLSSLGRQMDASSLASEIATRYAWRRVFDGLFDVYREVIAEYRSTPHD